MPISGMTLLSGSTATSITGGSAVVYKDDGADIPNGIHVVDTSVATLASRPHSTFKSKAASVTNGVMVKGKREVTHVRPKTLASGVAVFPLVRINFEIDTEMSDAELLELKQMAIQHIMDTELADFWKYGTTRS